MQSDSLEHQRTLRSLAMALERVCSSNADLRSNAPTVFDAVAVPAMSVHCYLVRMRRYTKFDFSCFMVAMTYLDRLCQEGSSYCPTMHNIHRLLVTALLVASKATDDVFHANLFMAQCGGISVGELNKLELELCRRLDWRLMPSMAQLHRLRGAIDDESPGYWDAWCNTPKAAATCDDIAVCKSQAAHEDGGKRMPHAKSFQDHLGRMLFGAGNLDSAPAEAQDEAQQQQKAAPAREQPKPSPPSPGSPRSVFRRIFSEQVFNFAT